MTIEQLTQLFGWGTVINLLILLCSVLLIVVWQPVALPIHRRLFAMEEAQLGAAYFRFLAHYKLITLVFWLTPYLALKAMVLSAPI